MSSPSSSSRQQPAWQVPQDHFLAQQGKAASRLYPSDDRPPSPSASSSSSSSGSASGSRPSTTTLPPRFFSPSTAATQPLPIPDTSTLAGADFDVDVRSGFLPPEPPLERIPDTLEESIWENALTAARVARLRIQGGGAKVTPDEARIHRQWRRGIREMTLVEPSHTMQTDIRFARRGHVVLTFLAHYYIHSQPEPTTISGNNTDARRTRSWWSSLDVDGRDARDEAAGKYIARLPPSISVPLLRLSSQLDTPPILTYADSVLWNWRLVDPSKGLHPSNIRICETFSNTPSEEHFFLTSLLIELRGVAALDIMRVCLDECFMGDSLAKKRVASYLHQLCSIVTDLERILKDVRTHCVPAVFYWGIRPWFRGGDSSPLEQKGWIYPTTADDESSAPRVFTGPSAGQSSLIHALDVFLDVDHANIKPRNNARPVRVVVQDAEAPAPQITADATSLPPDATFMQRMQLYMPGQHRRFLSHLQSLTADDAESVANDDNNDEAMDVDGEPTAPVPLPPTPLRHLATTTLKAHPNHALPKAYDAALSSLRSLRDEHMRVATLYIISQARNQPPEEYSLEHKQHDLAPPAAKADDDNDAAAKGTGGTNLVQFLKACRTNTIDALLSTEPQQQQK